MADGNTRARRVRAILRTLSTAEADAWLQCGRRMAQEMPIGEAEMLMWRELGRELPPQRQKVG